MISLIFRGLYILISLCLMLKQHQGSTLSIVAALLGILLVCSMSYLFSKTCATPLFCSAYVFVSFFNMDLTFLFPLIFFESYNIIYLRGQDCKKRSNAFILLCYLFSFILIAISLLRLILNYTFMDYLPLFLLLLLTILSRYLIDKNVELKKTVHYIRDTSSEQELALKKKNHELMEKQDYEVYLATLQERNRIAREIHDNVGHLLTRSILQIGALKTTVTDSPLKQQLEDIRVTLDTAMSCIRKSVHDLHDDSVDLKAALTDMTKSFSDLTVTLEYDSDKQIPRSIKYSVMAIVREALNNSRKHSDATKVEIAFRKHPAFYQLLIEDNGTKPAIGTEGIGLITMRERIEQLNGTIQFSTTNGFRIFICIPTNMTQ